MADMPMEVIMQQAFALKTAQMAVDRKVYDNYPSYLRNSLFSTLVNESSKVFEYSSLLSLFTFL